MNDVVEKAIAAAEEAVILAIVALAVENATTILDLADDLLHLLAETTDLLHLDETDHLLLAALHPYLQVTEKIVKRTALADAKMQLAQRQMVDDETTGHPAPEHKRTHSEHHK